MAALGDQYAAGHVMPTRRKVQCLWAGMLVKEYDYISQVSDDGYAHQNVVAVLKGRRSSAYGFEWEYA